MPEANVANTVTILGKTSVARAATHWKTIAYNDPQNSAALKINSLFITNKTTTDSPANHFNEFFFWSVKKSKAEEKRPIHRKRYNFMGVPKIRRSPRPPYSI